MPSTRFWNENILWVFNYGRTRWFYINKTSKNEGSKVIANKEFWREVGIGLRDNLMGNAFAC